MPKNLRSLDLGLVAVLAVSAAWGAWFIARTSFSLSGLRYFCLLDDAMISMTYAKNLLAGFGLNWARQGAPVEGFTHPLWVGVMTLLHLLPLPDRMTSLAVQLLNLVILALGTLTTWHLTRRHFGVGEVRHALPAAVLTACFYPLHFWSLMGMETGLQYLLMALATSWALDIAHDGGKRHLLLAAVLSAALLLRMDMIVPVAVIIGYLCWHGSLRRQGGLWLGAAAILAIPQLAYLLFRWFYFHDLLPNTYYLKLAGIPVAPRVLRGLIVFVDRLRPVLWPTAGLVIGSLLAARQLPKLVLPLLLVASTGAYSVYVGGDAWEWSGIANRFVAFTVPFLFVLLNALLNLALCWARATLSLGAGASAWRDGWVLAPATLFFALAFNGLTHSDLAVAGQRWDRVLVSTPVLHVNDHQKIIADIQAIERRARPESKVAVVWAGIPAYFSSFKMIDLLGYNDRLIAHQPSRKNLTLDSARDFNPGHLKWNWEYVLDAQRPDIVFQTIGGSDPALDSKLTARGYERSGELWVLRTSPNLRREALTRHP